VSLWRHLTYGLSRLVQARKHDAEIAEEVEQYFEESKAAWMERGLTEQQAARKARMEAGSMSATRENVRSYGWENIARTFAGDLRFACRQLIKHPAFAFTAIVTLAVGIGANTAIFTVVQSILLAPLPYANADKIVALDTHWTNTGHTSIRFTGPDAVDVRSQARDFETVSLYNGGSLAVQLGDHTTYAVVSMVDANLAGVFSIQPIAGRLFTDGEAHRAALVSEQFARDNFGSPQAAVGRTMRVENSPMLITGVLPASFDFPAKTEVWWDQPLQPESKSRTAFNYKAVARIRSATGLQTAQAELDGISKRLEAAYPVDNRNKQFVAVPLQTALTGDARPTLFLLWATVALILLIACVNVTHLQLVRSMERQREIAIRKALGSTRGQVMQPVILESLLVALVGGVAGILFAIPAVRILVAMAPKELPRADAIHLNGWVLAFTLGLSVLTAMVSSMLPALNAAKVDPAAALKNDASRGMVRRGASRLRDGMVVAEIAATFVLAVGAGLLLHTMATLRARDLGYLTRQLLVVDADAPANSDKEANQTVQQFNLLFTQLAAMPGVEHVAGIMGLPMGNYGSNGDYNTRGGLPPIPGHALSSVFSVASPGYFQTLGIPMERGRDFNAADTSESPFVAIISNSLARQSFGNADPVGKQIQCGLDSDKWMTIIGVVGDVRQDSPAEQPGPALYMPMTQHPYYANQIHIVLRTRVSPLSLLNPVQSAITHSNPLIALRFTTMDALVTRSIAAERFRAVLISSFAGVALFLAMLGVYGTMAYSVAQQTFAIGIRMAFGAEKSVILASVLKHAAKLAAFGVTIGLAMSFFLVRLVAGMLVGVSPSDPLSLALASSLLFITALAAAFGPGWKATHVNPMIALRAQ